MFYAQKRPYLQQIIMGSRTIDCCGSSIVIYGEKEALLFENDVYVRFRFVRLRYDAFERPLTVPTCSIECHNQLGCPIAHIYTDFIGFYCVFILTTCCVGFGHW